MYRDYKGFLAVRVERRICNLLCCMLGNVLREHLGDMSDRQNDSKSEEVVLTRTSGYVCSALT